MRPVRWGVLWGVALCAAPEAGAQGSPVFCIPNTQACFGASYGFVPSPVNPFYQNRLAYSITNLQGTYGGLNTPFGIIGLSFEPRWNANVDPRATIGWFDLPSLVGSGVTNRLHPGFDFSQPGGGSGYMNMLGTGYLGCSRVPGDEFSWRYATCPRDGRDGSLSFEMDLAFFGREGIARPATFNHFALRAITTAGSCTFTPSRWRMETNPGDACEIRSMTTAAISSAVTPEPATLLLVGSGLAAFAAQARRRRRQGAALP